MEKAKEKAYIEEMLKTAEEAASAIANVPEKNRDTVAMLANAYAGGIVTGQKMRDYKEHNERESA